MSVFPPERIERALGIELDGAFCGAARELWAESGLEIINADFTRLIAGGDWPSRPNLVLANPPYVRHHHLAREDKERLKMLAMKLTGIEVNGLAGLYVYFLILATAWMDDDGYAAWLVPSEFMDVNYGAALKRFLTDRVTLIRVHRFDPADVQFWRCAGVLGSAGLLQATARIRASPGVQLRRLSGRTRCKGIDPA